MLTLKRRHRTRGVASTPAETPRMSNGKSNLLADTTQVCEKADIEVGANA